MTTRTILLGSAVIAVAAFSTPAQASHFNGWYIGVEGGAVWVDDASFTPRGTVGGVVTHTDSAREMVLDSGWAVLATAGYGFHDSHFRIEAELGYRDVDIDHTILTIDGSVNQFTIMANVVYDIPLTPKLSLSLGAGAGIDRADLKYLTFEDEDWIFAYQGIVGLNYAIGSRTDLFMNYRYLRTGEGQFEEISSHRLDFEEVTKHTVTVGFRYDLSPDEEPMPAAAPPPPAPAPMSPPAHLVIFCGYNKRNITAEADSVLAEAAAAAKSTGAASVKIVGHTDTSGSAAYNQKLSECRADAAAKNLEAKGVPAGAISTSGKGENELMVQTGDGIKEPQNRRATVDLN